MGVDGLVAWATSRNSATLENCTDIDIYIREKYGLFVRENIDMVNNCSKDLCNSHGRWCAEVK